MKLAITMLILSILIPAGFAAIRYGIGTDYFSYGILNDNIKVLNIWDYFTIGIKNYFIEPLFYLLCRIVFLFGGNIHVVFFWGELLIIVLIFLAFKEFGLGEYSPFALLLYYLLFFAPSMNIVRQIISLSFFAYSIALFQNKKIKLSICMFLCAIGFHLTIIVGIPVYFLFDFANAKINKYRDRIYLVMLVLAPLVVSLIIKIALNIPLINSYFLKYELQDPGLFNIGYLLPIIPPYMLCVLLGGKDFLVKEKNLLFIGLFQVILGYFGYYVEWASRLVFYVKFIDVILMSKLVIFSKRDKKMMNASVIIIFYLLYFLYYYYYLNQNWIFPLQIIF